MRGFLLPKGQKEKGMKGWSFRFFILILAVAVSGLSQGLTLPLLAILIEKQGISSILNGWNAAALYIGMFTATFFVEKPLRKYGFKPLLIFGLIMVTISSLLIPIWYNLYWWFVLRFFIGVGDSALHYASQLWITSKSDPATRGRQISIYGFSYGLGFSIGPMGVNLLSFGVWVPFLLVALFNLVSLLLISKLKNEYAEQSKSKETKSYRHVWKLGWYALLPAFLYGYIEAVLNGSFPVYGLRIGLTEAWVAFTLASFAAGGLITQIPLGTLSDRVGRKRVLMGSGIMGGLAFMLVPWAGDQVYLVMGLFILAGCFTGSFFSLGLAYLADVLPKEHLPTGNVLAAMLFSIGSITGPGLAGMGIEYIHPSSLFVCLGSIFVMFFLAGFIGKRGEERVTLRDYSS